MIGRRLFLGGAMSMIGGLPPRRLDQRYDPPAPPGPIGGAAGTLRARRVIIFGPNSTVLVYSGNPASGDLAIALAGQAGSDQYGNPYQGGANLFAPNGIVNFGSLNPATRIVNDGALGISDALTDATRPAVSLSAPETSALSTPQLSLFAESKDTTGVTQAVLNTTGAPATSAFFEVGGAQAAPRLDVAPAATAPPARPAGTEPWNAMALLNGWANAGAPAQTAQYKLIASPPASILITGSLLSAGSTAAQIALLPAAYRPTHTIRFPVALIVGAAPAANMFGTVSAAGAVSLFNIPTAAGDTVDFTALIPLDA